MKLQKKMYDIFLREEHCKLILWIACNQVLVWYVSELSINLMMAIITEWPQLHYSKKWGHIIMIIFKEENT